MIIEGISICLIIAFLFYMILDWKEKRNTKKLFKNYDVNEDKSKQGELRKSGKHRGTESRIGKQYSSDDAEPERERLLQLPETTSDGESNSSTGKTSKGLRGIFRKLRRNK